MWLERKQAFADKGMDQLQNQKEKREKPTPDLTMSSISITVLAQLWRKT